MNGLLPVLLSLAWAARLLPQVQPPATLCDQHPLVQSTLIQRARSAGRGLRAQRLLDIQERAAREGRPIAAAPDAGGGACPDAATRRGVAAAAVGAVLYNGELHCSGVVVGLTTIITAAHCIMGFDIGKMEFVLGPDAFHPVQRAKVYHEEVHGSYDETRLGVHDIGVLYLERRLTEADPPKLADLPLAGNNLSLLHVGFGIASAVAGTMRCAQIPVRSICDYCYGYATPNLNTCNGDSGGGVFRDYGNELSLVGLTGWGDEDCQEFGVDMDIGAHRDWVKARLSDAPSAMPPARVEAVARKTTAVTADALLNDLKSQPWDAQVRFDIAYKGRWVTWSAKLTDRPAHSAEDFPRSCSLFGRAGNTNIWLWQYPESCDFPLGRSIRFTGRLARIRAPDVVEVVLPEPVAESVVAIAEPIAEYSLVKVAAETREVHERRSRDVRLESKHGSSSGRVSECLPVTIEPPWSFDASAEVKFVAGYVNHGAYQGALQNVTSSGFCVPLWAEGFGGAQIFGTTVDAGSVGVVAGMIEYGVKKMESLQTPSLVTRGIARAETPFVLPIDAQGNYELWIKAKDGTQQTLSGSGTTGDVAVTFGASQIEVRPGPARAPS